MRRWHWILQGAAWLSMMAAAHGLAAEDGAGGIIRVEVPDAEDLVHRDLPVSAVLPETFPLGRPWQLRETGNDASGPVPVQFEAGSPPRAWFVLSGETPAGSVREYELRPGRPATGEAAVRLETGAADLRLHRDGRTILRYHHSPRELPEGLSDLYLRDGYIHPVYSPSGLKVTEDFPADHRHHKGVWTAWTRTGFEGREVDFWNLHQGQGTVRFTGFETVFAGPVFAGFRSRHEHVDLTAPEGEKRALDETWDVRAWAVGEGDPEYWLWDLESRQAPASDSPLELLEYHYGGLGFRGAREWTDDNHRLLTSEGNVKADAHATRGHWVAHSGEIEDGREATVVMLVHPENYRVPTPMRVWESGGAFFCWAAVQGGGWTLSPEHEHTMRYRFLVHDGPIDRERAEAAWRAYAEPPEVIFERPSENP